MVSAALNWQHAVAHTLLILTVRNSKVQQENNSYHFSPGRPSSRAGVGVRAAASKRGGEGTADWDTAASNRSTGNCLSNFKKRISSKKGRIEKFELDEGFRPYHPPFRALVAEHRVPSPWRRNVWARNDSSSAGARRWGYIVLHHMMVEYNVVCCVVLSCGVL